MKKNEIPVVILKTPSGYSAHSPLVDGCVATGRTIDKTLRAYKDAVVFHLEGEHLIKTGKKSLRGTLRDSFDSYGTEAFYATIIVAA